MIHQLLDPTTWPEETRPFVTSDELWRDGVRRVVRAPRLDGAPSFYPLYQLGDAYSHSPLALIVRSGSLRLDRDYGRRRSRMDARYLSDARTLDLRVRRVGAPRLSTLALSDRGTFITRFVDALRADVASQEARQPGAANVVLCGGRDSLNLLLLPWRNPVLALSAAPNFALVERFVHDNALRMDVRELRDEDRSLLDAEILTNLCRNDLRHCRWSGELHALAAEFGGRAVFWKGQLGDTFLTPFWRSYTHPAKARRIVRLPFVREHVGGTLGQAYFWWSHYWRGAMWQGTHLSLLRDLTGALFLSAYHGVRVTELLAEVDLESVVTEDLRPAIGAELAGAPVHYPLSNPGPASSTWRAGASTVPRFLEVAHRIGLRVE